MKDLNELALKPSKPYFVHIDVSARNNAFRNPLIKAFARILDQWFGINMYSKANFVFSKTTYVVPQYGEQA